MLLKTVSHTRIRLKIILIDAIQLLHPNEWIIRFNLAMRNRFHSYFRNINLWPQMVKKRYQQPQFRLDNVSHALRTTSNHLAETTNTMMIVSPTKSQ